jgi:hypothetical protein
MTDVRKENERNFPQQPYIVKILTFMSRLTLISSLPRKILSIGDYSASGRLR